MCLKVFVKSVNIIFLKEKKLSWTTTLLYCHFYVLSMLNSFPGHVFRGPCGADICVFGHIVCLVTLVRFSSTGPCWQPTLTVILLRPQCRNPAVLNTSSPVSSKINLHVSFIHFHSYPLIAT